MMGTKTFFVGLILFVFSFIAATIENWYFIWNTYPITDIEKIWDIGTFSIMVVAVVTMFVGWYYYPEGGELNER